MDEDLYLGIVYFPPEYSSREKRLNIDHFQNLSEKTSTIASEKIILLGDFNARTGVTDDRLIKAKHDSDETPSEFFSHIKQNRCNQDKKVNKYGKSLLDYCAQTQSYIANGRTIGDFQGKLTCYETNGASTVDYAIIKECIHKKVKKFKVLPPSISDHCPITLNISYTPTAKDTNERLFQTKPKIPWNENTKNIFNLHINSREINDEINVLEQMIDNPTKNIDSAAEKVNHIFLRALGTKSDKTKPRHKKTQIKKWYDKSCREVSKNLKLTAYLLSKSPKDPYLRGRLVTLRKEYKKLIKTRQNEHKSEIIARLEKAEENNPKEYWNLIKMLRNKKNEHL